MYSGFPLSLKTNIPSFSLTMDQVDEEPLSGCAISKSKSLFIYSLTYSFIYLCISRIIKIYVRIAMMSGLEDLLFISSSKSIKNIYAFKFALRILRFHKRLICF